MNWIAHKKNTLHIALCNVKSTERYQVSSFTIYMYLTNFVIAEIKSRKKNYQCTKYFKKIDSKFNSKIEKIKKID